MPCQSAPCIRYHLMRGLRCARPRPACHRQSLLPHAPPRRFVWPPGFTAISVFSFFLAEFQPPLGPTPGQLPPHLDRVCCRIECNQCCGASRGTRRRLLSWRGRRAMMCAVTFALSGPGARAYTSAAGEPAGSILLSVDDGCYQVLLPVRRANLNHASERPQPCNKHTQLLRLP